ncbi:hypothetical protein [Culicoidibacter larvae]|uniref:Uncharacterized protein n=1 Tax=Culicoidibacter larvae TaxID=2579976 RepID=A0A5R8QDV8_9FIRM|nr:hypothetical protein [Culicoidibacter larvae]TLG75455.1 hypothetical protein FEZ08_05250 [Culicoidibacter larvae]
MDKYKFTKGIEKIINPMEVGMIHFLSPFSRFLPKKIQNYIVESSAKKMPYMGFVVEPYSYFLAYEIINLDWAKKLVPDNFKLVKSKVFIDDEPKYYCIFGCFNVHTSAFWGQRMEFYIIAEHKETGLLSWIIVDYDSNTLSYDKSGGLVLPDCKSAIITTNFDGSVIVDVVKNDESRGLVFTSDIKNGQVNLLDQRLWLEGNFSIGYGRELSNNDDAVFALKFNPLEVEKALQIPIKSLNLEINSWYPGLFSNEPAQLICFPYAQHFLSDSPGQFSLIRTKDELVRKTESINFDTAQVYSTKSMRRLFLFMSILPFIIIVVLLAALIIK